jgi:RecA-family ATPase
VSVDIADKVRERLPILDWHDCGPAKTTEEWIIEPILPARRLVALYSAPKVGKSLLMLELAVGIARGSRVLGAVPDRPRRVLYVDFENDP